MADPLDILRQLDGPVSPNPGFAAQLRERLVGLLGQPGGAPSTTGAMRLRPYLVASPADAAIAFYSGVLGARVVGELIRGDDGRVGHVELDIGGAGLYLADAYPEYGIAAPDPAVGVALHLEVADADAVVSRAAAAGAEILRPVDDQFYGSRSGTFRDPFGHQWQIDAAGAATTSPEERAREMSDAGFRYETVDLGDRAPIPDEPRATAAGLGYFTVNAPDGARAAAFYAALLGWDAHVGSEPGGYHVANISPPGGIAGGSAAAGVTVFYRVDDVAAAAERVRELGGTVLEETTYPSGGNASCLDDQGIAFQLWQPAPGY